MSDDIVELDVIAPVEGKRWVSGRGLSVVRSQPSFDCPGPWSA